MEPDCLERTLIHHVRVFETQLLPIVFILEIVGSTEYWLIDWTNVDTFPPVQYMASVYYAQRAVFALLLLAAWLKLFEYLSVFTCTNSLWVAITSHVLHRFAYEAAWCYCCSIAPNHADR